MNLKYVVFIVAGILTVPVTAAENVSSCIRLIPHDHEYEVIIKYDVSNHSIKRRFIGVTDKNFKEMTIAEYEQATPFARCFKKKVNGSDTPK